MPIIETGPYTLPIVAYDAPVNEKTQKVREMFKIGENGYPEHYQWRGLARLGPKYQYQDPFYKFDPAEPKEFISTKVFIVAGSTFVSGALHLIFAYTEKIAWWSKPYRFAMMATAGSYIGLWAMQKTSERRSKKIGILLDYTRQHPERFGEVKRYKLRELVLPYVPIR